MGRGLFKKRFNFLVTLLLSLLLFLSHINFTYAAKKKTLRKSFLTYLNYLSSPPAGAPELKFNCNQLLRDIILPGYLFPNNCNIEIFHIGDKNYQLVFYNREKINSCWTLLILEPRTVKMMIDDVSVNKSINYLKFNAEDIRCGDEAEELKGRDESNNSDWRAIEDSNSELH